MSGLMQTLTAGCVLVALTTPLAAQTQHGQPDPLVASARDAANYIRDMFTKAAENMSEEDFAFKPTPDVRSFGQLLAHVADTNYWFCSAAQSAEAPVRQVEKTAITKGDIQKALSESFTYCDEAYAAVTDASRMIEFQGKPRPALAVLLFRTHHGALHYGNVVTYMRLRGKVPPSTEAMMKK